MGDNSEYRNKVISGIDRMAARLKALVLRTDYVNYRTVHTFLNNIHTELNRNRFSSLQDRPIVFSTIQTGTFGKAVEKAVTKATNKVTEICASGENNSDYVDLEHVRISYDRENKVYKLFDSHYRRKYIVNISGADYSGSYLPWRQLATKTAENDSLALVKYMHERVDKFPIILIPSGEGKTTMIQNWYRKVIVEDKKTHTTTIDIPASTDHQHTTRHDQQPNSVTKPRQGIIDYDDMVRTSGNRIVDQVTRIPVLSAKLNHKAPILVPFHGLPLSRNIDLAILTPNPTYVRSNIISRLSTTTNYVTATRQTRNDAIYLHTIATNILHQHPKYTIQKYLKRALDPAHCS